MNPDDPISGVRRVFQSATQAKDSERAVSFTVGYVITLGITTLLVAGVLLAAGQVVSDQRSGTVTDQATVVGDKVAASVMAADRLVQQEPRQTPSVTVPVDLPARFVGEPYRIVLQGGSQPAVIVRVATPSVRVRIPLRSDTTLEPTTVTGGPVRVVYIPNNDDNTAVITLQKVGR